MGMLSVLKELWDEFWAKRHAGIRKRRKNRPIEEKVAETLESYEKSLGLTYQQMGQGGASIGLLKLAVTQAQGWAAASDREVQLATEALKGKEGPALEAAKRNLAFKLQTRTRAHQHLDKAAASLAAGTSRQEAAKFMVQDLAVQQQQAKMEMNLQISESKFNDVEERLLDIQASMFTNIGGGIVDNRKEIEEDLAEQAGRIEGKRAFVDAVQSTTGSVAFGGTVQLSDAEMAAFNKALEDSGHAVETPAQRDQKQMTDSNSTGS